MDTKLVKTIKFISAILICQLAGFIGSIFTTPAINSWYVTLQKPSFNPPNWIFAPVWTILFVLMGISLYLIWEKGFKNKEVKFAILLFGLQLVLNVLWSVLFFGLKSPPIAFVGIILLWFMILLTTIKFYKISKLAAYLLIPYILWVSFATILNFFIVNLNTWFVT